jgi:hypothetical protein
MQFRSIGNRKTYSRTVSRGYFLARATFREPKSICLPLAAFGWWLKNANRLGSPNRKSASARHIWGLHPWMLLSGSSYIANATKLDWQPRKNRSKILTDPRAGKISIDLEHHQNTANPNTIYGVVSISPTYFCTMLRVIRQLRAPYNIRVPNKEQKIAWLFFISKFAFLYFVRSKEQKRTPPKTVRKTFPNSHESGEPRLISLGYD